MDVQTEHGDSMEHIRFLTAAMKDKNVGAVVPTSASSVRSLCRRIDCDRPVVVVEYGPGTGVFTRHLLKRLHPESTLIAIELNRVFASRLRRFGKRRKLKSPRFVVANDDAGKVQKILRRNHLEQADYVISGIPFSLLDEESRRTIVRQTAEVLSPQGRFFVYQYSFLMRDCLEDQFGDVRLSRSLFNIPPLCVMDVQKPAESLIVSEEFVGDRLESSALVDAS